MDKVQLAIIVCFFLPFVTCLLHFPLKRHSQTSNVNYGSINFPLHGFFEQGQIYATLTIGTPQKHYNVLVDTATNILWLTSIGCSPNCTRSPGTTPYDCLKSSTSFPPDHLTHDNGDVSSGYIFNDLLSLEIRLDDTTRNYSVPLLFGLSTQQNGSLLWQDKLFDGVMELGPGNDSLVAQLSRWNLSSPVFSISLSGDGGSLMIGEVGAPGMVYSPFIPSQSRFIVNLQWIEIGGRTLLIDPSLFAGSTSIHSASIMTYLRAEAYETFVRGINLLLSPHATLFYFEGLRCFTPSNRTTDIFPRMCFRFEDNVSMVLEPKHYLIIYERVNGTGGPRSWCLSIMESPTNSTILGDMFLRNRIVEFDPIRKRFGVAGLKKQSSLGIQQEMVYFAIQLCTVVLVAIHLLLC